MLATREQLQYVRWGGRWAGEPLLMSLLGAGAVFFFCSCFFFPAFLLCL